MNPAHSNYKRKKNPHHFPSFFSWPPSIPSAHHSIFIKIGLKLKSGSIHRSKEAASYPSGSLIKYYYGTVARPTFRIRMGNRILTSSFSFLFLFFLFVPLLVRLLVGFSSSLPLFKTMRCSVFLNPH